MTTELHPMKSIIVRNSEACEGSPRQGNAKNLPVWDLAGGLINFSMGGKLI